MKRLIFTVLVTYSVVAAASVYGNSALQRQKILSQYLSISKQRAPVVPQSSIYIESKDDDKHLAIELYVYMTYQYRDISGLLASTESLCELFMLILNVKGCVHGNKKGERTIRLYAGSKGYTPKYRIMQLNALHRVEHRDQHYILARLMAKADKSGNREFEASMEATSYKSGTLVHIMALYRPTFASRIATGTYLRTLGRKKVGFSVIGKGKSGEPVYIKGMPAMIERNAVRSILALEACLAHRESDEQVRLQSRLARWAKLTASHPRQLYVMSQTEYISMKIREQDRQKQWQIKYNQEVAR